MSAQDAHLLTQTCNDDNFYYLFIFRVQYHDSYKFNAKSYHSMQYHFKSIDTWLMGNCRSHCQEHSWKRSKYQPGKKSIFAEDQANETQDQDAEQEDEEIDSQVNDDEKKLPPSLSVRSRKDNRCDSLDKENLNQKIAASHSRSPPNTNISVFQELPASSNNNNVPTDHQSSAATTSQCIRTERNFLDLDECVSRLLSKISLDLESEFSDTSSCSSELEPAGSPQWIEAASSSNQDIGRIEMNPSSIQRTVDLSMSELERNCFCPQCCRIEVNCIHQDSCNITQDKDEETFGSLEDCKEFSSSLECFDFVHGVMNSKVGSIIQCPNNSNSSGKSNSRRSVSPSKAAKNGKGKFHQYLLIFPSRDTVI